MRDPLLRAAAVDAEDVAVAADQPDLLVREHPGERGAPLGEQDEPGVAGQVDGGRQLDDLVGVEGVSVCEPTSSSAMPVQPTSTGAPGSYSSASRPTADALTRIGRSLLTTVTCRPSAARLRATERMRVSLSPSRKPDGEHAGVDVVEFDPERAPGVPDRERGVEPPVLDAQVVEQAQGLAGEIAQFGVVPLGLELGDDHDREDDLVLGEAHRGARVREHHRGVEDERAPRRLREQWVCTSAGTGQ